MLVSTYLENYLERQAYRASTSRNYTKHIKQLGFMQLDLDQVTPKMIMDSCARIDTYTVRRSALISCRAIFKEHLGLYHKKIPILPHVQKVYEFPTQDELHEMINRTKYRLQLLLCMYAGLMVGEACGIRKQDLIGNRLTITRQVSQDLYRNIRGHDYIRKLTIQICCSHLINIFCLHDISLEILEVEGSGRIQNELNFISHVSCHSSSCFATVVCSDSTYNK